MATTLDQAGYRLTKPRRALVELVERHDGHFTAADIASRARSRRIGISRATLFRALDLLTDLGLLERVDLPSGEHAYVKCAPVHHHHVLCTRCGRSTEVEDQTLAGAVVEIARQTGYRIDAHRLELFGLCWHCRSRSDVES
jgi:Fur family ferric uptake transcriptional regulator